MQKRMLQRALIVVSSFVFSAILIYMYESFTVPTFGYMGYSWRLDYTGLVSGLLLVLVTAVFLPVRHERPGDLGLVILFCFAYAPSMVMPSALSKVATDELIKLQITLALSFLLICLANRLPITTIRIDVFSTSGYELLLIVVAVLMVVPVIYYLGIPATLPMFGDVYEVRFESRRAFAAAPFYVPYFWAWLAKVVAPMMIGYGLLARRPISLVSGILIILYLYGLNGTKGVLFAVLLILAVIVGFKVFGRSLVTLIVPGFITIILASRAIDFLLGGGWFSTMFVDRTFVMPGVLTGYYQDYFLRHGYGHWAYSFLSWAYDYPYQTTPPFIIGLEYYGNPESQANAHLWADGFANFGYGGVVFVSVLAGLIIWIGNSLGQNRWWPLTGAIIMYVFFDLAGSSIFTSMLTGGIVAQIILVGLLPKDVAIATEVKSSEISIHK